MKRRFILFALLCAGLLTLGLSAIFLPIMKGDVDGGLRDSAKSALASAHISGVTADSDWATVTLTGPQSARASALAAVGTMAHAGAVDKFVYRTAGPGSGPAGSSPSPVVSSAGTSPSASASSASPSAAGTFAAVTAAVSGTPSKVTLSGTVATAAEHQAILSAATAAYGAANVTDHITVAGGPAASADTAAAAQFGQVLAAFGPNVASGTVSLASGAINVTATGRSAAGTTAANAAVSAASTAGVSVSGKVSAPAGSGGLTAAQAQAQIRSALGRPGITFAFGSAALTSHSTAILTKVAAILATAPHTRTLIAGYTDNKGSTAGNLALSRARAQAVRTFLAGHGIAASRMKTAGYGESHPVASNATAAGQLANRRVVFTVQGS
jgi:OOP family OmpA-OmpF porin